MSQPRTDRPDPVVDPTRYVAPPADGRWFGGRGALAHRARHQPDGLARARGAGAHDGRAAQHAGQPPRARRRALPRRPPRQHPVGPQRARRRHRPAAPGLARRGGRASPRCPSSDRVPVLRVYLDALGLGGRPLRRGPSPRTRPTPRSRPWRRGCRSSGSRRGLTDPSDPSGHRHGIRSRVGTVSDALVHRADDDRIAVRHPRLPREPQRPVPPARRRAHRSTSPTRPATSRCTGCCCARRTRSSAPAPTSRRPQTVDMVESAARSIIALQRAIAALPVPVVTRLDGPVRAGGLGLVASAATSSSAATTSPSPSPRCASASRPPSSRSRCGPGSARARHPTGSSPDARSAPTRRGAGPGHPRRRPPTRWMPWSPGCSTTCAPAPARAWSRPSGCSPRPGRGLRRATATRWPGSPGSCSTRRRAGADGGRAASLTAAAVRRR